MTNKAKKQTLLGASAPRPVKKIKRPPVKKTQELTLSQTKQAEQSQVQSEKKKTSPLIKWLLPAIVVLVLLVLPKPQLVTYQKLDVVSQSIYWPGGLGIDPMLMDSHQYLLLSEEQGRLYLCRVKDQPDTCQQYQIVRIDGFFAALFSLLS